MNRYNSFDDRNCDSPFDNLSCKRHHPQEYNCTDREPAFCCANCPPGLPALKGLLARPDLSVLKGLLAEF